jgi:hypothetical protein
MLDDTESKGSQGDASAIRMPEGMGQAFRIQVPELEAASKVDTTLVNAGAHECTVERISPGDEPWLAERCGVSGQYFLFFLARADTDHPLTTLLTAQRAAERFPSYKHWSGDFQQGCVCFAQNMLLLTGELTTFEQLMPALVSHLWTVGLLESLEEATAQTFQQATEDVHFTHGATRRDLPAWTRIGARTRRMGLLKAIAIILKEKIWRDTLLVGEQGKLVKVLNSAAALEDRVAILGDKLQFASDVYAVSTDQLTGYAYFYREYKVELWIVMLLSLQRHFGVLSKFTYVESRLCGRQQRGKAAFDVSINPCARRECSRSVAVGLLLEIVLMTLELFRE